MVQVCYLCSFLISSINQYNGLCHMCDLNWFIHYILFRFVYVCLGKSWFACDFFLFVLYGFSVCYHFALCSLGKSIGWFVCQTTKDSVFSFSANYFIDLDKSMPVWFVLYGFKLFSNYLDGIHMVFVLLCFGLRGLRLIRCIFALHCLNILICFTVIFYFF